MARIPEFTRRVMLDRAQPSNIGASFAAGGGNAAQGLEMQSQSFRQAAARSRQNSEQAGIISEGISSIERAKQNRYDTVQRARAVSQFQQETDEEFSVFQAENDMTNPDAPKGFNQFLRNKRSEYLQKFGGSSAESQASLDIQLTGLSDQYSLRMAESGRTAQREFITGAVGEHINRITNEVYQNPNTIEAAFKQLNGLMVEYGSALDSVDEIQLLDSAQSMVIEGAVNSFLDAGDYEGAQKMVMQNDRFIMDMPPQQQMSVLGRINSGLAAQEQERNDLTRKMNAIQSAADAAGVTINKTQLFSAATGIKETETPDQRVQTFAKVAGIPSDKITPAIVAKIGFGVDLPAAGDIDMNKERLPDGGYTPKGIGAAIKTPFDAAANTKVMVDKILLQANDFVENNNSQAGLAAMVAFQKLIDDGAAVREGDIQLSAQGNSAFDNIKLMMDQFSEGAIATPRQIDQMKRSAEIFGQAVLEASKTYIDPYLQEGRSRGYRMIDIGMPQASYDRIFKDVKTSEDVNRRNSEIDQKAASFGMSPIEYMTATAKKHNMTVKQVADKLGYTGKTDAE